MVFYGISKVTLIDYPGKIACTVFVHGCNFRCPFCHNPELVIRRPDPKQKMTEEELLKFLSRRKNKLDGVVFTGGEPLIYSEDLIPIIKKIKDMKFKVKVDTNGTFPNVVNELIKEKLVDFVALDFKGTRSQYLKVMKAKPKDYQSFQKTLNLLKKAKIDYEIRTTITPGIHTINDMKKMAKQIKSVKKYAIQNFVPNGTIDPKLKNTVGFSHKELLEFSKIAKQYIKKVEIRNDER